jgi:tetratricopeptide (TPR) repeat protein
LAANKAGEVRYCNGNIFPLRWDRVPISPAYIFNGVFRQPKQNHPNGLSGIGISMRRPHVKQCFATVALLAAFLSAEHLRAGQTSLEKAESLLSKGATAEAAVVLRQIVTDDPRNVDAHLLLGTALALVGERSESISQMAAAVRLRPDSAGVHNQFGMVLSRFIEVKAARQEFEKALELNPALAEAHVNLSLILAQAGDLNSAGDHLDQAIKLQGDVSAAAYTHYLRAKIWGAQNQVDKSIDELEKSIQLRPDYADAWSDLGGMRRLSLDRSGAVQALEKAVALNPHDSTAQYRLGQLYLQDGETDKALDHLKIALLGDPSDLATLYSLDRALRKAGKLEEANPIEKQLAELRAKSDLASTVALAASRLNDEGIALEKSGNVRAALAKYRAALDLDPTGAGFQLNYGLALCRLGRWDDGIAELREVLRLDPNNQEAANALYIAIDEARAQPKRTLPK